jgi:hypothetical protein
METYEFLILPVNQVPPFDLKQRYVTEINGVKMATYLDWMKSCYYISVTGHPAISVPCGFTPEGLPVGVQIVGRHHDDFGVLQLAYAFEQATGIWKRLLDGLTSGSTLVKPHWARDFLPNCSTDLTAANCWSCPQRAGKPN